MRLTLTARQFNSLRLAAEGVWLARKDWEPLGLPSPIRKLLG